MKKEQSLPVCHNTLIRVLERPPVGRHVIKMLPHTILPPKIICASFIRFPAHCVISTLLKTVHGHHVRRASLRTAPPPLCAIPEAERSVNIDYVEFRSHFTHIISNPFRKFGGSKPVGPFLLRQQVLEKNGLHAVSQLIQLLRKVVDNPCDPGLGLPPHPRDHQNSHLCVASLCQNPMTPRHNICSRLESRFQGNPAGVIDSV